MQMFLLDTDDWESNLKNRHSLAQHFVTSGGKGKGQKNQIKKNKQSTMKDSLLSIYS